jgi:hypothetical protein
MIDKLLGIFGIHRLGMLVQVASQVVRTFEQEFKTDGDAKNAAIDAIIDILKSHKTLEPSIPIPTPETKQPV